MSVPSDDGAAWCNNSNDCPSAWRRRYPFDTFNGVVDATARARRRMVDEQLARRGIIDARVLAAMDRVPRHEFVSDDIEHEAYSDTALPIGHGATISQPYIVALMAQALRLNAGDRVLEIGTGSGYAAAVLAELAAHVTTVECVEPLAVLAARRLSGRTDHIDVIRSDGTMGHEPGAPYDAISVAAAGPSVPPPLLEQLSPGGRLVMPVGTKSEQLLLVTREPDGDVTESLASVRFVPLQGRFGA